MKISTLLKNYFTATLPFCNSQKVKELLVNLGYEVDEPTAQLCLQAYKEYGVEFTTPYGKIAKVALQSPKYEAYLETMKTKQLNKATDTTAEQKLEWGNLIISNISSWLASGKDVATAAINKNANESTAQASLYLAQTEAEKEENSQRNKWIIFGIVGIALFIVIIVLVVMIGKR